MAKRKPDNSGGYLEMYGVISDELLFFDRRVHWRVFKIVHELPIGS